MKTRARPLRIGVAFDAQLATRTQLHRDDHPVRPGDAFFETAGDSKPVAAALRAAGHRATLLPLDRDAARQLDDVTPKNTDLVFNLCDTLGGESRLAPLVPALLEAKGVPVVGADQFGLAVTKRKHDVKALLDREGLPTPRYQVIDSLDGVKTFRSRLELPVILKLTAEHSSIGIEATSVCFTEGEVRVRARHLLRRFRQPVLVEEFVQGREFYVSFFGDPLVGLPLMEHTFEGAPEGGLNIRTFDMKWFSGPKQRKTRIDPRWAAPVPHRAPSSAWKGSLDDLAGTCARALTVCGARDWGRVDVRIDRGGVPMIIDVTPNTYLGPTAPCARAATVAGMTYDGFVASIAAGAWRRARR